MASERQIAANRRNAQKSTGPRSTAGKRRASRNAYRHGFAAAVEEDGSESLAIEVLAAAIAATGPAWAAGDPVILAHARAAARAERALTAIRARKAMILRGLMTASDRPPGSPVDGRLIPGYGEAGPELSRPCAMPSQPASVPKPHTDTLPELTTLLKLDRYEKRARASRDRAIVQIMAQHLWATAVHLRKRHSD
jgi:hypothetical protein